MVILDVMDDHILAPERFPEKNCVDIFIRSVSVSLILLFRSVSGMVTNEGYMEDVEGS